jgi:hypothetical protein
MKRACILALFAAAVTGVQDVRAQDTSTSSASSPTPARPGVYMNVSFVGLSDFAWSTQKNVRNLWVGDHDPKVRGFSIPNGELALDGAVDPYFKGFANIVYKLDENGESEVELEEMYALTTSLPHNLQLKAGQFFAEFGRQNSQHPHSWAFGDEPLVLNRMFGPEGLRSQGVRASWLAPTPFFTEVSLGVFNATGGTAFSFNSDESSEIHGGTALPVEARVENLGDMLYVPRIASSFDLSGTQALVVGVSGAVGPNNAGLDTNTQIFGADVYYKWKSARAMQGFPFVSFQSEFMTRRYEADASPSGDVGAVLPERTLKDNGAYAQILWGIKPLVVAGVRGEYAKANDDAFRSEARQDRYRMSTDMTWFPTEFSKFRLQYNYDYGKVYGVDHSFMAQLEFLLGAHAAHKF